MENTTAPQKEQAHGKMGAKAKRKEFQSLKNGVISFNRNDDKIQLLLEVVKNCQSIQAQSNLDWIKIRTKQVRTNCCKDERRKSSGFFR